MISFKSLYWKLRNILFPQQSWIKKTIEWNDFQDKDVLMENFLLGCVVHFVEVENNGPGTILEEINNIQAEIDEGKDWFTQEHVEYRYSLLNAYHFAKEYKQRYDALQTAMCDGVIWEETKFNGITIRHRGTLDCNELMKQEEALEAELDFIIKWIVANRGRMWI